MYFANLSSCGFYMDETPLFDEIYVSLGIQVTDAEHAIRFLGEQLQARGVVKDSFISSTIQREREFATGLPLGEINISLPHTDSIHVNRQGFALGVMANPVDFHVMGAPDQVIPVHIVILMAIKEQDNQVKALQKLAELFQNPALIQRIYEAKHTEEILDVFRFQSIDQGK